MRLALLLAALSTTWSCGGAAAPAPDTPGPAGRAPATPAAAPDTPAESAMLTEAECGRMSDHLVNVRVDEMRAEDPDVVPTAEKQAEIREKLRAEFTESCVAEPVSRDIFECWLKATTTRELAACAGASEGALSEDTGGDRNP